MFLPADFEGGGGHGGELGGDVEDAVEFAVGKGLGYGCGDAGYDSAVSNPLVLHVPLVWRVVVGNSTSSCLIARLRLRTRRRRTAPCRGRRQRRGHRVGCFRGVLGGRMHAR